MQRKVETGLALLMVAAITALWVFGSGTRGAQLSQTGVGIPGGMAVAMILAIIALNGLFVAAGTAIDLLKPLHVKHYRDEESERRANRLQRLFENRVNYSAACILGSHICRVSMVLAGLVLAPGVGAAMGLADSVELRAIILPAIVVAIPILLLNLIIELIPKSFASLHPARSSLRLYGFVVRFAVIFAPPARLITAIGSLITSRFGARASFTIENQAEEEIKSMVEDAQESGAIEEDEKELLHSVFEFTDTIAREVMTPRVDLDSMPVTSDPEDVAKMIEETGHSRIPLYEETDDQIVGVILAKDLLNALRHANGKKPQLKELMRAAFFVPETLSLHQLLGEMRAHKTQLAVVQDEFGGTAGIVTVEDIVEELVGDIVDEYDEEEPEIVTDGGALFVDGKTDVDDVNDALGIELDSEEFDTIGGYVFGLFGRQPKPGETVEAEGFAFTVVETDGRRISRIKIEPCESRSDLAVLDGVE